MLWLWNFFLRKRQFSYVLIAALVIAGAFSLIQIPKQVEPPVNIAEGIVVTALPSASASDIETLVTNKLEDQISGINNIDQMNSVSSIGVSEITVQFTANANIDQSIQNLRDAVAKAVPNLPTNATTPSVTKVSFSNTPYDKAAARVPPPEKVRTRVKSSERPVLVLAFATFKAVIFRLFRGLFITGRLLHAETSKLIPTK